MMNEVKIKKEIFQRVKSLREEVEEGLKYGIPHLVGELVPDSEKGPRLDLVVTVFSDSSNQILLRDGNSILFMMPVDDSNPRKIFLELWAFLSGRTESKKLEPGTVVRGILKSVLQRSGYNVIWMNVIGGENSGYVEVLVSKGEARYRMTFEKRKADEFVLVDMERL
ncbi:hypothetical protein X802_07355 [Thermococcus guaymasensis DSM 11113]|uniref:Uncharacterized protein n=1 Tax=Thermococcus guaymasensis DSM 11113 TaxID=1432656 RepID=A0A0X1KL53_9EURY|nr:hypothetical protein [Thermococcus guaymasensis]AJC71992.1 hypothetical protein X802_07355 [Thermococcus guaymasensis DSM 11113]